jgi:hypothetical protein
MSLSLCLYDFTTFAPNKKKRHDLGSQLIIVIFYDKSPLARTRLMLSARRTLSCNTARSDGHSFDFKARDPVRLPNSERGTVSTLIKPPADYLCTLALLSDQGGNRHAAIGLTSGGGRAGSTQHATRKPRPTLLVDQDEINDGLL